MTILATYREPFGFAPHVAHLPEGETLSAMRARMLGLPPDFDAHGVICINGHVVPRGLWSAVRPKAPAVTEVTFHCPPQGGEDNGKSVLTLIASIALTVATGFIAGGGLATKFGLSAATWGAGQVGALALAAGVSLAGSLVLSALVPPPSVDTAKRITNPGSASADGNVLDPNTPIPRVIGQRKVFPPLGCEPLTYFDGPDEIVEAAYVLAGPHLIEDIRMGAAAITATTGVEYEVRAGWPGEPPVSLLRRQSRTESVQAELRGHVVSDDDGRTLDPTNGEVASALPQPQVFATRVAPDEHWLHLIFAQGLHLNASETNRMRVPLRLRIRRIGSPTWIKLPELHFQAASIRQLRATISLVWGTEAIVPQAPTDEGFVEARRRAAGQGAAPASDDWVADGYFGSTGDEWLSAANSSTSGVQHVLLTRYTAKFVLDPAVFPRDRYEVEVLRGAAFVAADYSAPGYTVGGSVWDLFGYRIGTGIVRSRDGIGDNLYVLRSMSVWNEHPLPSRDLAIIAVRSRNRQVDSLSCIAGGWVRDWDGTGWRNWTVTANPAPHLRDIYSGAENLDPVPLDLIDDAGLVAWRQACIDRSYTCNALIEDQTVDEAARIVAACGYAKPYMSDIWGVVRDYDRSAVAPVQMFTPRNSANFQWTKGFARIPDGFRVNYRDGLRDYEMRQISVFRPGHSDDSGRMEQITLEGLVTEADVIARAEYDQQQAQQRNTFYSMDVSAEVVLCRRGDLVAVQHDMLTEWAGSARVIDVQTDLAGDVTGLVLDVPLPVASYPFLDGVANLATEPNLARMGVRSGVAIRRPGGVTVHPVDGAAGNTILFDPTISPAGLFDADDLPRDTLVAVGPIGRESLRLIVFGVTPKPNFEAAITLVDEAPQLWT